MCSCFIDSYWQLVAPAPDGVDEQGDTVYSDIERGFDRPNLHVMVQGSLYGRYRYFVNMASPGSGGVDDEPVQLRNAWVEAPLVGERLGVRAGKLYRRFGLYNEILDAVPTFIGIEPPELFDKDHLMLTRTTNLMLFGTVPLGGGVNLNYAATTGNDESTGGVPLGLDVHARGTTFRVGSSFYTTGGPAGPTRAVGEGSPRGGVANWMAEDQYMVYGGYAEVTPGPWTVQAEYWRADHDATRDPAQVGALVGSGIEPWHVDRFVNADGGVVEETSYTVQTAYGRLGYAINVGDKSSVVPYLQTDWYSNPELVGDKDLGGDNEAGLADNGQFLKFTAGSVIRPVPEVALKLDGSGHLIEYNGASEFYPEVRASFSYMWQVKP
jgi:hypothetical protein